MIKIIGLLTYRIKHNKAFLITYLILIPIVIGIAVYFTNSLSYQLQIGIVGNIDSIEYENINFIHLNEEPSTSEYVLNQYDAVLIEKDGNILVQSTKGTEFDQQILSLITNKITVLPTSDEQRGTATNILGFLMMLISLLGVQIYQYYFDERKGINKRILSTSVNCWRYMIGHFIVAFNFILFPALVILIGAIFVFDISLSIPLWQFTVVLSILSFFATAFGLWINSLCKTINESMMLGNMFAIVGTIMSGGFVQVTDNEIFSKLVQIFPQKHIMDLIESLENNSILPFLGVVYVLGISLLFIGYAIWIEKKKISCR